MAVFIWGCENESNNLVLIYNDGDGISVGDPVFINAKDVGEVEGVEISKDYEVIVKVNFRDSLPPQGSQFFIKETGFLGERAINVISSRSRFRANSGDTVSGSVNTNKTSATSTISNLLEKISLLLSHDENDSLLNEIVDLKAKVDSLEEVRNNIDSTRNSLIDSSLQSSGT